jgi:hypothetical protein
MRKEGGGKKKKDLRKKKAFTFFRIEIIVSFFSLFSFVPQKSAILPMVFYVGVAAETP